VSGRREREEGEGEGRKEEELRVLGFFKHSGDPACPPLATRAALRARCLRPRREKSFKGPACPPGVPPAWRRPSAHAPGASW